MKKVKELVDEAFEVAKRAKVKGLDPTTSPESEEVVDLASLVEVLVGPKGVAKVIRELSKSMSREEVAFKLAEKTVKGEFFQGTPEQLAEQAIRVGLAVLTEGVTAAPVQGISMVKIKNGGGEPHLAVYFAGPIRSAGGTDQALTVVLSDFVRQALGLPKFAPTKEAVERFIEEIRLYEQRVTRFQYRFSDENLRYVIERLPIEVTGVKTEEIEVATHRNVPGVETNGIRGGALLVVNDGLTGRAAKVVAIAEKIGLQGWEWLKSVVSEKTEEKGIMEEVIAGRPVFSSNKLFGGFRLRYGRSRNTGLAGIGVHPVVMKVLKNFLAIGTQVRMDVPSKGGVVAPVDYLEPPIIKLTDGSVVKVTSEKDVPEQYSILFLGDILISFGDFLYSNKTLLSSGYVEEFWSQELKAAFEKNKSEAAEKTGLPVERLETLMEKPFTEKPTFQEAVKITAIGVPLHPNFVFYWSHLSVDEAVKLRGWLKTCSVKKDLAHTEIVGDSTAKVLLEKILVPHAMQDGKVVISGETASALLLNLGFGKEISATQTATLDHINALAGVTIRDKAGSWLDARMGRPEKAKRREMKPVVHVLFPVGFAGGSRRNILDAEKKGEALFDLENRKCPKCGTETFRFKCPGCASITESTGRHSQQKINLRELIRESLAMARVGQLKLVKGVRGLTNKTKTAEPIIKGILRAKYDLSVFRDGTVRFDATNAPLTHFKPIEINLSVEEAKQLGYQTDFRGAPLESPEQVCELDFQDIIIPRKGAEYLVKTAQFIDELLIKYYGEPPFYKLSKMEDLVGCLIIGLAPHTICGIFGRIIGITESQVCYAHPVWHSAKRRDCFSPETVITIKNLEDGIRNVRIKELVEEQFKRSKPQVIDDVGTEAVPGDGLKAATFNWQTDEIEFQPISQYLKGKMGRMMVAFSTKSGRTAHVTPYHKALVLKDGEWQKIKAVEIENETILPTAFSIRATPKYHCEEKLDLYGELLKLPSTNAFVIRNIKFFLKQILREHNSGKQWRYLTKMAQQLQIPPNQLNHWINRGSVPIEVMAKILSLTGAKTLPEEATIGVKYNIVTIPHLVDQIKLARFLGLITAEGWLREKYGINQTAFRNTASQILKEFDQLVFDLFKLKPYAPPNERDKRYICSKVIIALLRLWGCGRTSHEKRVPTIILNGDRKIQLNFLATYLEGDGNAHPEVGISFYTSSEMLQYDLSLLLSTMDIYCTFYVDNDRMGKTLVANYKKLGIPAPQLKVYRINISSFNAAKLAKLLYPLAITKKAPLKIIAAKTVFHPSYKMGQTVFLDPVKDHISTVQAQSEDYCIDVPPDHTVLINGGLIMANCDGDEDGLMLALDCLINFSKFYLSEQIGGIMDAPLMLSSFINLDEVQRQALEVDVAKSYPLEFYQATFLHDTPRKFAEKIKVIDSLRREKTHAEFTVPTSDINRGNQITLYSRLPSMAEKIEAQFDIMERLAGVDVREVALNVLNTHFMKDIIGNLRAFTTQTFRCKSCNKKYRRPPLSGKCLQCNGELAQTVYRGGIEKYLDQAEMLITKYNLPSYYYQRIQLVKSELDLLFGKEEEKKSPFKQGTLADFV